MWAAGPSGAHYHILTGRIRQVGLRFLRNGSESQRAGLSVTTTAIARIALSRSFGDGELSLSNRASSV